MDDAQTQQIEVRAAVHGAFDELQPMHISFHRTVAPGLLHCGEQRSLVAAEVPGKNGQQTELDVFAPY